MYMITHGRIALSYLREVITSGFQSLMIQVPRSVKHGIGVGLAISAIAGLVAFIALNLKMA